MKSAVFGGDDAGQEVVDSGDHAEGSRDRVIPDPVVEPSSKWTKAELLHELLKGSDGIDELRWHFDGRLMVLMTFRGFESGLTLWRSMPERCRAF